MKTIKHRYDQLRVIASPNGVTVVDEKRNALTNVFGINLAVRPGKPPVMQLNLLAGAFDVAGVPTFLAADPAGGPPKAVKSIEWWDGTGVAFPEPPPAAVTMQPPVGGGQSADPAGVRPITPVADVRGVTRQLVDVVGGTMVLAQPIDLPAPPDGKRWETDAELRDRAIAAAQAAATHAVATGQDTQPAAPNGNGATRLDS